MRYLTNKEAPNVLCSVVKASRKRLEHERSRGKHEPQASVSPYFLSTFNFRTVFTLLLLTIASVQSMFIADK